MFTSSNLRPRYRVGDEVVVRSLEEILDTLDDEGKLEGMPFMPEMIRYCGRTMRVAASAHKTCDGQGDVRRMNDAVHLESARCDGSAHDGCQQRCRTFWKCAWIRPVEASAPRTTAALADIQDDPRTRRLHEQTRSVDGEGEVRYSCQFTCVVDASQTLPPWEPRQYVQDVTSGNRGTVEVAVTALRSAVNIYQKLSRRLLPSKLRFKGGAQLPVTNGQLRRTPRGTDDLDVGERVRVRSLPEIRSTLDARGRNRGLKFGAEESTWCGATSRVERKVDHIIDETTGKMLDLTSDCIVLEGIACRGKYFRSCPRGGEHYWRAVWLDRLDGQQDGART